MKRTLTILSVTCLFIFGLLAANQLPLFAKSTSLADETMAAASQLYEAGQFSQAALTYQQLVDQGYADSALFYNLGNAYYKQGDLGRAILNYRRAEALSPRDADIAANLALAQAQITDPIEKTGPDMSLVNKLAGFTLNWLTLNELAVIALSLWVFFALLVITYSNIRRGSALREGLQYATLLTAVILALSLMGLGSRMIARHNLTEAVVTAAEIKVTASPGAQTETAFTLHSGAEVELLEERGSWVHLALPQTGLQGWAEANAIEKL